MTDGTDSPKAGFTPGMVIADQYRIERELKAGAMGVTYIARDLRLRRLVVIKTLLTAVLERKNERELFLARFEQEAVLAAQLSHRAIIPIFQFGEHGDVLWYAMEYIANAKTLRTVIEDAEKAEGGPYVPLDDVRAIFMDIASALGAIHDVGAVHRDVKADNTLCFWTADGVAAKVLDFGVAHLEDMELTRTGQAVGTPSHMAPEYLKAVHAMERPKINALLDLFALGVMLYKTLTANTKPFTGTDWWEIRKSIMAHTPTLPSQIRPDLPPWCDAICMGLLAKRPENRTSSARDVYDALKNPKEVPVYEPPANDSIELPNEYDTAPGGRVVAAGIGSLPDLSGHTASQLAHPVGAPGEQAQNPQPAHGSGRVEPAREAQLYKSTERPKGRFASLPGRLRLGIAGLLIVVAIIAGLLIARGLLPGRSTDAPQSLLDPAAAASPPEQITADELLRDQDDARRQRFLAEEREARLQAGAKEPVAAAKAIKGKRRPRKRKGGATLASRSVELPKPPGEVAESEDEPRRKKSAVVTFDSGEDGTESTKGKPKRLGIPTGYKADAKLETPVSSAAPNTLVTAILPKGVRFPDIGQVLPKGTRALGKATFRVQGKAGRVEIRFTKLVLPDRTERPFVGIAVMSDGQAGLVASVSRREERDKSNAAEAALDVVDGVLDGVPGGQAGKRFTRDGRQDARELRENPTVISVVAGTVFKVQFTKSL